MVFAYLVPQEVIREVDRRGYAQLRVTNEVVGQIGGIRNSQAQGGMALEVVRRRQDARHRNCRIWNADHPFGVAQGEVANGYWIQVRVPLVVIRGFGIAVPTGV